jgi:hypothetical protein
MSGKAIMKNSEAGSRSSSRSSVAVSVVNAFIG